MSRLDDLMAQCVAAPDSDAPRLVWADAVGGERGELVVLQCRLASGVVSDRDEWRALRARERELLAANSAEWSGGSRPALSAEALEVARSHGVLWLGQRVAPLWQSLPCDVEDEPG
jgi:hypothetical protein